MTNSPGSSFPPCHVCTQPTTQQFERTHLIFCEEQRFCTPCWDAIGQWKITPHHKLLREHEHRDANTGMPL